MNTSRVPNRISNMGKDRNTQAVSSLRSGYVSQNKTRSCEEIDWTAHRVGSFDDFLQQMKRMIDDGNAKIEKKIDSCNVSLVNEIATLRDEVHQLKSDCVRDFNQLRESHAKVDVKLQRNRDAVDRLAKSNDLLLTGVPYSATENTNVLLKRLAVALGYCESNIPLMYTKRLSRAPIIVGATPPILLQFAFRASKDEFFVRYLSRKNLSLSHLGVGAEKRVYLNENLTETARIIKGIALKLKRSGHIKNVFTKGGVIFVKPLDDVAPQPIFDDHQLVAYGHRI